jgi:spore coat polysaccharide biosynthesis predicted glycosyltransferase SpsG
VVGELGVADRGRVLVAYDPALKRQVWIHQVPAGSPAVPFTRRQLARPARLRWLTGVRTEAFGWDAYEAPDGASLRRVSETALVLGADVLRDATPRVIATMNIDVVVIDDPIEAQAREWVHAARQADALVVTVHDRGSGCGDGDLVIDGSVARQARAGRGGRSATGTRYAVLNPAVGRTARRHDADGHNVLIALGGGPRARLAAAIARGVAEALPKASIRVAGGFTDAPAPELPNITWVAGQRGLHQEFSRADVAVVGGGVSLYEACAAGIPAVAVPVVRAQLPTVRGFARRGAALGVGFPASPKAAAVRTIDLLGNKPLRLALSRRSREVVDGLGAARAAAAVLSLTLKEDQ